ncbi:MAG: SurA N-terminal domain-containing protein [Rickettsiaceae bacterium H1]|nr:SurA N-terminal domain-containing protein [Rickettsiaceae bacterium H1]
MQFKAKSFFTTSLLVIIAIVMGLSGINQVFTGNNKYVAKVGKSKITLEEYQRAYDIEKTNAQNMFGINLTGEQLKNLGFKQIVLDKLVQNKLLENLAHTMNLNVNDRSIKQAIKQISEFQDENGNFNKEKFSSLLQNNNINETDYITYIKDSIIKNFILDSFQYVPGSYLNLAEKIYNYRFEQRIVEISTFTPEMVKNVPEPTEKELKNFYNSNQYKFRLPQQRKAEYIAINKSNVDNNVTINDEEVSDLLKNQEERIDITYTVAKSDIEAKNIINNLKKENKKISDVHEHKSMKNLSKSMLPNDLEEIFSLAENEISKPIKAKNTFYLFQVEKKYKITEEEKKNIELEIRTELANGKINERLEDLINTLEEKLSSKLSITELAKTYNLKINEIGPIKPDYKDQRLVKLIFDSNQEENNQFFTSFTNNDGTDEYYNIRVKEIIPSRLQKFDECKSEVKKSWKSDFINKKLYETAKSGKQFNKKQETIVRTKVAYIESPKQNYPENFVNQIFDLSPGQSTSPVEYKKDNIMIGKLVKINSPKKNEVIKKEIEEEIKKALIQGIYSELKHYLHNKFTVAVNEKQ